MDDAPLEPTPCTEEGSTSPLSNDAIAPAARRLTDRYEFLRELGRGGMAIVYLAREMSSGQIVAIKLLGASQGPVTEAARRFAREAETVASLEHPNIVRVLRVEDMDGPSPAIVSVYIPGETLRELLRRGPLPYERAAQILREMASALAYAHGKRIVHRDVKPENIVLELHTGRALLADFGVARQLDSETILTAVGTSVGTPTYMAPEQIIGSHVDARADVYALGLIGWEMLSGRRPWEGETLYGVLHKQQHEKLPPLDELRPDIPTYLLRAIAGAIEKDPNCRWKDAAEFLEKLNPAPAALPPLPAREDLEDEAAEAENVPILVPESVVPVVGPPSPTAVGAPETPAAPGVEPEPVVASATAAAPASAVAASAGPASAIPTSAASESPAPGAASHPAFTRERRQPRTPRRWLPAALAAAAVLLIVALIAATRHKDRSISGDRSLDSLLTAANHDGVAAAVVDSAYLKRPKHLTAAQRRKWIADSIAHTHGAVRSEAAGTVDLSPQSDARCRSPKDADQKACLMHAVARNDAALNAAYQALINDILARYSGADQTRLLTSLRGEQRASLETRDAQCRAVPAATGDLWGVARAPCFALRSSRRAAELQARIGH